jgi:hypothetical protein
MLLMWDPHFLRSQRQRTRNLVVNGKHYDQQGWARARGVPTRLCQSFQQIRCYCQGASHAKVSAPTVQAYGLGKYIPIHTAQDTCHFVAVSPLAHCTEIVQFETIPMPRDLAQPHQAFRMHEPHELRDAIGPAPRRWQRTSTTTRRCLYLGIGIVPSPRADRAACLTRGDPVMRLSGPED